MFKGIKKLVMDILTEDDANSVFCPVRVIAVSGILTVIIGACVTLYHTGTLPFLEFGGGVAGIAGAAGAGIGAKAKLGG